MRRVSVWGPVRGWLLGAGTETVRVVDGMRAGRVGWRGTVESAGEDAGGWQSAWVLGVRCLSLARAPCPAIQACVAPIVASRQSISTTSISLSRIRELTLLDVSLFLPVPIVAHSRPDQEDDRQEAGDLAQVGQEPDQAGDQVQDPLQPLLVHARARGLGQGRQAPAVAPAGIAGRGD